MRTLRSASVALCVLTIVATLLLLPTRAFFFNHGPNIDGNKYSYEGEGDEFDKKFKSDDPYTDITLTNWDLNAVLDFTLPAGVKKLTLFKCNLSIIPEEVYALENLQELNLQFNHLTDISGNFSSAESLVTLNMSSNAIKSYTVPLPVLSVLDLSSNALTAFPNAIFASLLRSFYIQGNGFLIASVSMDQYDFFAGLADFEADFSGVTSCSDGELVSLKGNHVCRVDDDDVVNPTITPGLSSSTSSSGAAATGVIPTPQVVTSTRTYLTGAAITLVTIGVTGAAAYAFIVRRRRARLRGKLHENTPLFFDSDKRSSYQKELAAGDKLFPSNDSVLVTWRIDYDSVKLVKKLSKGAYGEVWIGKYRGAKVAVKRLLENQVSFDTSENFVREIKLMAWLRHPKIIEFIGVAWTKLVDMLAVLEYMDSGDLRSLLEMNKSMPWKGQKLQYAIDTIDAIVYLHSLSPMIIHRDLKSRNIFIDSRKGAKLGDFGISAAKRDEEMTTNIGTARWLAPELARGEEHYTEAVDIYSFGIILSELDTHKLPFYDAKSKLTGEKLGDFGILQGVSTGDLKVTFTTHCPPKLLELAQRCMSWEPNDRPTAAEVAYQLRQRDLLLTK